jgi:6-phosphogluconolactonase
MSKKLIPFLLVILLPLLILLDSCDSDDILTPIFGTPDAVYTQDNRTSGNNVVMYPRSSNGSLGSATVYSTGGTGTGTGLGSQGALAFNNDGTYMLVVNAGSNDVSIFSVTTTGLVLQNRVSSGGIMPISVAVRNDLVYVLNAGGSGNITGFRIGANGSLTLIANSTANLSNNGIGAALGPAQISFNPSGSVLVVTEKMSNLILTYTVNSNGTVNGPNIFPSAGVTPFGFEFRNDNQVIISEAFGGAIDSSAVTSYSLTSGGSIGLISGPVFTTETAACWIVITHNGNFTYTSNTGSNSITGFSISAGGVLSILNSNGVTASTGAGSMPIDMALSSNSQYLYSLNSGNGTISAFSVNGDGSLTTVSNSAVSGLPIGATGLLAK